MKMQNADHPHRDVHCLARQGWILTLRDNARYDGAEARDHDEYWNAGSVMSIFEAVWFSFFNVFMQQPILNIGKLR